MYGTASYRTNKNLKSHYARFLPCQETGFSLGLKQRMGLVSVCLLVMLCGPATLSQANVQIVSGIASAGADIGCSPVSGQPPSTFTLNVFYDWADLTVRPSGHTNLSTGWSVVYWNVGGSNGLHFTSVASSKEGFNNARCPVGGVTGWVYGRGHADFNVTLSLDRQYRYTNTGSGSGIIVDGVSGDTGLLKAGTHTFAGHSIGNSNFSIDVTLTPDDSVSQNIPLTTLVSTRDMSTTPDPINIATGEMFVPATDFFLKGRGPTLELSRTYRSQAEFSGLFGYGWRGAYDVNLTEDTNGNVIIFDKDGVGRYFTFEAGSYTPSPGNHDTLVKDPDGTFAVTDKHGTVTNYNQDGRISSTVDRNGNTPTFIFNSPVGTYIEDAGGRRITLAMDSNGRIQSARDPAGHVVQYAYDTNGNLTTITDAAGNITRYVYDANHNITEMTNVNGHKTYFAYDGQDRAITNWQDGDVNKVTLSFNSDTQTTVTDALGYAIVYQFNEYGLATSIIDPLGNTTTTVWDESLNRISTTDARGNATAFAYDVKGNLVNVTDALGGQTQFVYTPAFNLLGSVTDALDNTTSYTYNARGNLLTITDAEGNQIQMSYDADGNPISTRDALNHAAAFEYDGYGRLLKTTDALANITALTYDAAGNNTSVTDPKGAITAFVYDALNRLTQITFADGTGVSYSHDAFGNRLSMTGQKSNTTVNTYDTYERLIQTTDALGGVTQYNYDKVGNMIALTDANGHTTNYSYDANGRLLSETTSLGHTTSYSYDAVGNLIGKIDPNGATIAYSYDTLNRLTRTQYPDGTSVAYSYDALGRQVSMTDWQGTTLYSYDSLGRLLKIEGPASNEKISYTYDALGNRTSMINQDGETVSYGYDALNRLTAVSDGEGLTTYSYDALSNITRISYPNGAPINYSYDVMNRPLLVVNKDAKNKKADVFGYVYDPAGMVTKILQEGGVSIEYSYDAINRLVREKKQEAKKHGAKIKHDHQYSYDAVGNRLEFIEYKGHQPWKKERVIYSYDAGNRLLSLARAMETSHHSKPLETADYIYDANGNRMSKAETKLDDDGAKIQTTFYSYDYENRLTALEYVGRDSEDILSASFEYNGNGIRTKALEGGEVTRYYHDGLNVLLEKDASGLTQKSYTRALGFPGGIGGLISMKRFEMEDDGLDEKTHYYHYDALGSVRGLSDGRGKLKAHYDYDAFGDLDDGHDDGHHHGQHKKNTYLFSSKELEDHAGLYYFGARYYDPEIGRWLTQDPSGFVGGINYYAYVHNNPINYIDPFGFREFIIIATTLNVSRGLLGTEAGEFILVDPKTNQATRFRTVGFGLSLGLGGGINAEIGSVNLDDPQELEGFGIAVTGFVAAKTGIVFSAFGTGPFGSGAAGITGGGVVGAGFGLSGSITRSGIVEQTEFIKLPEELQQKVSEFFKEKRN